MDSLAIIEEVKVLYEAKNTLGEGPIWDSANERLIWVDILEKKIHTLNLPTGEHREFPTPGMVGCVGLTNQGNWIIAIEHQVGILNPTTSIFKPLVELETTFPRNRFNDGKCSPNCNFIVGSMDMDETSPNGALYQIASDATTEVLLEKRTISNGIAWSADQQTIYTIDTPTMRVMAHTVDPNTGRLADERAAVLIPDGIGYPDGMTIDNDGNLWIAMWGGARITLWDPRKGILVGEISLPCLQPTSCTFGGADGGTLFITSARVGMTAEQLTLFPNSGDIFTVRMRGVSGPAGFVFREI